jgi:hypothetical protein
VPIFAANKAQKQKLIQAARFQEVRVIEGLGPVVKGRTFLLQLSLDCQTSLAIMKVQRRIAREEVTRSVFSRS